MATLTDRAERALLGAIITSPDQAAKLSYLQPGDFTAPRHQAVYAAITRTADIPGTTPGQRNQAIAAAAGHSVTTGYLEELQAACPDPGHGPAYGAMILQARLGRQMTARARDLADQSRILAREARRVSTAGAAGGPAAEDLASHLAQLANTLSRHAHRIGAAPERPAPARPALTTAPRPARGTPADRSLSNSMRHQAA